MKRILLLSTLLILSLVTFCQTAPQYTMTSKGYTIEGRVVKGSGYITLKSYLPDGNMLYDSTRMDKKGKFSFVGHTQTPIPATLTINGKKEYRIYLEPNMQMKIQIDKKKEFPTIKDAPLTTRWYSIVTPQQDEDNDVYLARLDNWALTHPEDIFSSDLMASYLSYYWDYEQLSKHLNVLKNNGTKTYYYTHLRLREEQLDNIKVSSLAPNIVLKDLNRKQVALADIRAKSKYVLIDFFASWSNEYKELVPNLLTIYKAYNKKGFDIYSVCLDRSEMDWKQTVKQYRMSWTNVSDLQMWDSKPVKDYMVKSIPYNVLIDNTGKIIATNLTMAKLKNTLSDLLDHQAYNIAGNIAGITEGTATLELLLKDGAKQKFTSRINNGNFAFTGELDRVCMAILDLPVKDGQLSFFMGNDNITITGEKQHLNLVKVQGSSSQDGFLSLANSCNNKANPMQCLMDYVNDNPSSIYSPFILSSYLYPYLTEAEINEILNSFSGQAKDMFQYALLVKELKTTNEQKDALTNKAKDFTLFTVDDQEVNLSNQLAFSEYTLLYFWASWDNISRSKNLDYVRLSKNYTKTKRLNIITISLDDNKYAWRRAIEEDAMENLTNLSDLKRWSSACVKAYDLKTIPYNILLDRHGNIIGQNLSIEEISSLVPYRQYTKKK